MVWDEKRETRFKTIRGLAMAFFWSAPFLYLAISFIVEMPRKRGDEYDLMLQILLIAAIFQPLVARLVERFQISMCKNNKQSQATADEMFFTLSLIKFALVEAIYLYGLVVYLVSGNHQGMMYFYPIGIIWTFIVWPKRAHYENFIQRIESNVPYTE